MGNNGNNSLNISGSGSCCGGDYDQVEISGHGKITDNLTCDVLHVSGMAKLMGSVACRRADISGMGKVIGALEAKELEISGKVDCESDVIGEAVTISGMCKIKQCLNANEILRIQGMITVGGDINGEQIISEGMVQCEGLMNCETLSFECRGISRIREIGGTLVEVRRTGRGYMGLLNFLLPSSYRGDKLVSDLIEGDEVSLEYCEVKVVRGKKVRIGEGCKIGLVEYSEEIITSENASVETVNKLEA